MVEWYFSCHTYIVFPSLGRVTGGMPPKDSANLVRRSIVGVACTRIIGRGCNTRSIGIVLTNGDQPADVLLQVSLLN